MKNSKKNNIKSENYVINNGYIDIFYSFKLCSEKEYIKNVNKMSQLRLVIIEKRYDDVLDKQLVKFKKEFEDFMAARNKESIKYIYNNTLNIIEEECVEFNDESIIVKMPEKKTSQESFEAAITLDSKEPNLGYINENLKSDIFLEIDRSQDLKIIPKDKLVISQTNALQELVEMKNLDIEIMQKNPSQYKMQWLLQPFKVKIFNNIEYVNVYLNFYANGNAVLRLSIPVRQVDLGFLHDCNWNNKIKVKFLPQIIVDGTETNKYVKHNKQLEINEVAKMYMNFLKKNICNDKIKRYDVFVNTTLIDYSLQPENFDAASNKLKELIFGILFSPFNSLTIQENNTYNQMWKNNYFSMSKYLRYYFSTNCRSIAIYSSGINNLTYNGLYLSKNSFYFSAIHGILQCIENILLKKYVFDEYQIFQLDDEISLSELRKLKKEMLHNENLVYMINNKSYGTFYELMQFAESKLSIFMPINNINQRGKKIEELIKLRESEVKDKFNIIIGFSAVLLTIILGLPNIENITKSLDYYMINKMNKYANISDYSIQIWLIINLFIFIVTILIFKNSICRKLIVFKRKFKNKN